MLFDIARPNNLEGYRKLIISKKTSDLKATLTLVKSAVNVWRYYTFMGE